MDNDINVVAVIKGEERYIFVYRDGCEKQLRNTMVRFSMDDELSFQYTDCKFIWDKVRERC